MSNYLQTILGFARPVHLWTWLLFSGGLALFSLVSLRFLYFDSVFCGGDTAGALPGECFYFLRSHVARLGIKTHLWCILPSGILAGAQFIPVLRRPANVRIHRVIGYASIVLALAGTVAVLPLIRHAFGGELAAQAVTALLLVLFLMAQVAGYVSIKQGNVYSHRQWMLRSWFYAGSVVSLRIISTLTAVAISFIGGYYSAMPCDKINFAMGSREETLQWYPECSPYFTEDNVFQKAVVDADLFGPNLMQLAAALNLTYGMSAWLALVFHVVGSELYIRSTIRPVGFKKDVRKSG
ncbi:hypothetical protein ANO14919_021830 [Xylariales sp. No.14919]|nr:hypothetical protein F5X98DRAFT_144100 [Xylaria grammica]GAW12812.1 hypothetical protein ANO14919_021830 [Xylariales sp. No.14919]